MIDEPHDQPPPLPPQPPTVLMYHQPERPPLPIGVQALLGVIVSVPTLFVIACLLIGMASAMSSTPNGTIVGVSACGLIALGVLGGVLYYARQLRKSERSKGWALGIYIGLGLTALFWGSCGLILYSLSNANFH